MLLAKWISNAARNFLGHSVLGEERAWKVCEVFKAAGFTMAFVKFVSLDLQTIDRRITEVIQLCVMIFAILIELKQNFRVKCNRKLDSWDPA